MHIKFTSVIVAVTFLFSCIIKAQDSDSSRVTIISLKKMNLSGYTEVRYQQFEDPAKISAFDIHRARLQLRGSLDKKVDYYIQTDVVPENAFLLDATASYAVCNALKFIAGQMKLPFSQENLLDDSKLFTINRSQAVEALVARSKDVIGNQNGRDIGLMATGNFVNQSGYKWMDYSLGAFNGQGINQPDANNQKDFVGRLLFHPLKNADIGGAYYAGYDKFGTPAGSHTRDRVGVDLAYTCKRFDLRGEFIQAQDSSVHRQGYYVQAACFISSNKLQIIGKYDSYDPNINGKAINDQSNVLTGGLNYFFTANLWIKLNYEKHDIQNNTGRNDIYLAELLIAF